VIRINEDDTTSSSRIFIKILCQELSENMGLATLRQRYTDPYMADTFRWALPLPPPLLMLLLVLPPPPLLLLLLPPLLLSPPPLLLLPLLLPPQLHA
jgi:hypothetical protein